MALSCTVTLRCVQHVDHRLAGQPVEKDIRLGGMHLAVLDEKDVGPGAFGDIAAIIHEQRVRTALGLGRVLGGRADHVKPGRLGVHRDGFRAGAFPLGDVQLGPLELGVTVIGPPFPGGDGEPDRVARRGDAHVLARAAPGNRPDIGIGQTVGGEHRGLGGLDLVNRIGDFEVKLAGREVQPFRVVAAAEDGAAVGALALEHRGGIVQCVGHHVHLGRAPVHQLAVQPDFPVAIVVGPCHCALLRICICCAS